MGSRNERQTKLGGERSVEFMLSDQSALQKKLIGRYAASFRKDCGVAQGLRRVTVMGQEADLHRQSG
jgi:hypothetical protein